MLKRCIFVLAAVLVPVFGYSFSFTNLYLKGFIGPNFVSLPSIPEVKMDTEVGYAIGGSIGYEFLSFWSVEGELCYRNNNYNQLTIKDDYRKYQIDVDGNGSSVTCTCNLVIDFPLNLFFTPYFGFGFGGCKEWGEAVILKSTPHETGLTIKEGGAIYQVIGGVNLLNFCSLKANVEYHLVDYLANLDGARNHTLAISCRKAF